MMRMIGLGMRNLLRNRGRSSIAAVALLIGVGLLIFGKAQMNGMLKAIVEDNVLSKIGAIQIYHAGYLNAEQDLLRFDMADDPALVARMRAIPGVRAVTRRLAFEGMLGNGSISALFVATAIDPRAELEVCPRRHISMDPQQKLDPRDASGIFIGSVLAEGLSAKPGTTLFASSSTQAGAPNALDVVLRGTLPESGGIFENKAGAIVPLATAQELLRMPGRVTEYVLSTEDLEQAPRIAGELRKLLGSGYEVKIWRDWPHIRGLYQLMDVMGTVWASLLSVLVISVIMNTMLMSIFERVREIGTMLAIGIRRRQVMTLFLIESGILGFFGALGGAALGMGIIRLTAGGIPLPATEVSGKLLSYPFVTPGFVVGSGLAAILVAVLASLYPAWKGSRMKPVDALREAS